MKLFFYELLKLLNSRFVVACIVVLLILNVVICAYTMENSNPLPEEVIKDIYSSYLLNAQSVDDIYTAWIADYHEYEAQYQSYIKRGGIEPRLPDNYWLPDGMSDARIYDKLYSDVNRPQTFRNSIAETVKAALASKISLENSKDIASYEYLYQEEIIARYTELHDQVYIGFENTRGYDTYLECRIPLFLSIIAGALVASYYYTTERASASLSLIRCTKNGRFKLTGIKIAAAYITTFTFFVVSQLTSLLIVGSRIGFSSPYNSIQAFENFTYCPFKFTVIQYCLLDLSLKILCLFSLVSIFILAAAKTDYLTSCAINICISVGVIAMYYITQNIPNSIIHLANPLALAFDSLLRYRAINLFGVPYQSIYVICGILVFLTIICTIISWIGFTYSTPKTISFIPKIYLPKIQTVFSCHAYSPSLSLLKHELYKVFSNRTILVSIFVFFVLTAIIIPSEVGKQSTDEAKLQDYIQSSLYGESTVEKFSYINSEGIRISNAYIQYNDNVNAYYQGKLALEQFKPIADERAYADSRKTAYEKLKTYSEYLASHDNNKNLWFVYETGWTTLFSDHSMIVMIIVICFVSSIIVGTEYKSFTSSGGFHQILRTTPGGRSLTYKNKLLILLIIIFIFHSFYYAFQFIVTDIRFSLDGLDAPLKSLSMFYNHFLENQTIGFYLLLHYVYQLILSILLGFLVMGLTYIFKKGFIAFISIIICCILPPLLEFLGISIPACLSVSALMNLTNLTTLPMKLSVMILSFIAITVTVYSCRKFTCE